MSKLFIFFLSGSLVLCSGLRAMSEKLDSESTRVLEQYATNEKLLEQLLEVSVSQNVAQNQIAKIPDSIGELEDLTGLYLSGNYISELPEALGKLHNLRGLYIKGCPISQFPCSFGNLTGLEVVICGKALRECLPYHIRRRLKDVIEKLKEDLEQSGHPYVEQNRELVSITVEIPHAYQVFLMDNLGSP